jgi:hypothetical protein
VRRAVLIAAVLLAACGAAFALSPFHRPSGAVDMTNGGKTTHVSSWCSPPILSAWRTEHLTGSYTYLSASPVDQAPSLECHPEARSRVELAAGFELAAVLVLLSLRIRPWRSRRLAAA